MPLLTDPRRTVEILPPSMLKEISDGDRLPIDSASARKPKKAQRRELPAEKRNLEAASGEQPKAIVSASGQAEGRTFPDLIHEGKYLNESHPCWSLSASKEFHGDLPMMLPSTKELIKFEAGKWAELDQDPKWERFK